MNDQRKEEAIALINAELEYHRNEYRKAGIDIEDRNNWSSAVREA